MSRQPRLFVVSGPSGAGKGTVLAKVREDMPNLGLTVSATTREPRAHEVDGVSYHFMSESAFKAGVDKGEFLEWANVHGHLYGTPWSEVHRFLDAGQSVVLEIDVQGALNVRKMMPEAVLIFIEPPSLEVLEQRLRDRGTEDEASIELRLANAAGELNLAEDYDVRIVNDSLDAAVAELEATIANYQNSEDI